MEHLLAACTVENEEALRLSMDYGLRIGDVLKMPAEVVEKGTWSFREEKTGKRRYIRLSASHIRRLRLICGKYYAFEHRLDPKRHRTRQAVFKDLRRAAQMYRIKGISPHSCRKVYGVAAYKASGGNLQKVKKLLNHSDEAVTVLYALADELNRATRARRGGAKATAAECPQGGKAAALVPPTDAKRRLVAD